MSNGAPYEYQKALITAARTYAYWHLTHPGKHITFTVDSTYDQVYRGHDRELQQPNIVRAVEETRGQIVHYSGAPVVTPYYANSDGRTRAWTEVWGGGAKPWLVSVEAKYDKGKKLWGHGVGMSARDAAYRADEDKWSWDQLLKYYYTSIDLKRLW
jgi:stage II sporulation protein D